MSFWAEVRSVVCYRIEDPLHAQDETPGLVPAISSHRLAGCPGNGPSRHRSADMSPNSPLTARLAVQIRPFIDGDELAERAATDWHSFRPACWIDMGSHGVER
jgi:hypothetical protein